MINEDLNESIKSNTGRNTNTPSLKLEQSAEQRKRSVERPVKLASEPIEVVEMEHEMEGLPDEEDLLIKNIFKENEQPNGQE